MSDLVRYILENLKSLSGFHILLVLLLTGLLTALLTKVLVKLFEKRLEARDDLIGLKESVLAELKARVAEKEEAVSKVQVELEETRRKAADAEVEVASKSTRATELEDALEALAETGLAFQHAYYNFMRIYLLQRMLDHSRSLTSLYFEIAVLVRQETDKAGALRRRLDLVSARFLDLDKEIPTFPLPQLGQFRKGVKPPEQVVRFPYQEVEEGLREISEEAGNGFQRLTRLLKPRKP